MQDCKWRIHLTSPSMYEKCCKEIHQHYNGMMGLWIIFSSIFQHSFVIFIIHFFLEIFTDFFLKGKAILVSR